MQDAPPVENSIVLTSIFGGWPSFHDAEIVRIVLERVPDSAILEATIHVFEMTSELDERGYYVNKNHRLVTLRFEGLSLHCIKWFNHQNAINGLDIGYVTDGEGRLGVSISSNNGCDAEFDCDRISVVSVEPYANNLAR